MKIVFLGGGALRLLGTVDEILRQPGHFPNPHLIFMDTARDRAETIAVLAKKMPSALNSNIKTEATDNLVYALENADFVYCCIRVGGIQSLERDKRIGANYGFHGHDDFGPSGLMLTARTVPVILSIAKQMEKSCPNSWLMIFTNPISTLIDAVTRYSRIRTVGLCPGVYNFAWDMDHLFGIGTPCVELAYRGGGINHFSWVCDATYKGEPLMDMIRLNFDDLPKREGASRCGWNRAAPFVNLYGAMFLNNGHQHHFFYHDELAHEMAKRYSATPSDQLRSSIQNKQSVQAAALAKRDMIEYFWEQEPLKQNASGPFGDIGVNFMAAIRQETGTELAVTTHNHGHIQGLMPEMPVEATSHIHNGKIDPLGIDPVPNSMKGLCNAVAHHLRLSANAAVAGDKQELFKALLAEPTIRSYERAKPMFDELWEAAIQTGEVNCNKRT